MKPIIELFYQMINSELEKEVFRACSKVGVKVDRERLIQAVEDARAFYEEGYADGKRDSEPKKPFVDANNFYKCPCCHTVLRNTYKFCYECGCALDWSDENAQTD